MKQDPKLYIAIMLYEKEDLKQKSIRKHKEDHYILIDKRILMNKKWILDDLNGSFPRNDVI